MNRRLALLAGATAAAVGWGLVSPADARPAPPPAPTTLVGIFLDAETNGLTTAFIDCGGDNTFNAPEGDATLFIANVVPGRLRCTITISRVGQEA
jgi:hypothetical protein